MTAQQTGLGNEGGQESGEGEAKYVLRQTALVGHDGREVGTLRILARGHQPEQSELGTLGPPCYAGRGAAALWGSMAGFSL